MCIRDRFFEGWPVVENGVDAKLFFGRLRAATTAAPRRIILLRDKQLDPSLESANILASGSPVCVGMFIAISSVALGIEAECFQIAFLSFSKGPIRTCLISSLGMEKKSPEKAAKSASCPGASAPLLPFSVDLIWIDSAPVNGLVRFLQFLQKLVVVAPYSSPLIRSQPA